MVTVIPQLAVGIVLNDRHAIPVRQFNQFLPSFETEGRATWVLEVREDINELWPDSQRGFQLIYDHAILIRTDRDVLRAVGVPGLQRTQIGRRFDHNIIAAVEEQPSNKIQ